MGIYLLTYWNIGTYLLISTLTTYYYSTYYCYVARVGVPNGVPRCSEVSKVICGTPKTECGFLHLVPRDENQPHVTC